jgi:hypothetical protein
VDSHTSHLIGSNVKVDGKRIGTVVEYMGNNYWFVLIRREKVFLHRNRFEVIVHAHKN